MNSKLDLKNSQNIINNHLIDSNIINIKEKIIKFNDYELNTFSYNNALKYDKRTYFQYYISLIRTKHPLIFAFFPINDYNSRLIKISIFLFFFAINYSINSFFMDASVIHVIYIEEGNYNYIYFYPQIIFSFIYSHIVYIILKYCFLSEKGLTEIRNEKYSEIINDKVDNIKRCLVIKYICFYAIGCGILIFFWYILSTFGAVYQNTQIYLVKNTLTSMAISFIYPFIINLIPGIFRIVSLKDANKNKSCMYKFSKVIQFI
jgi:hypothetical protein